MQSILLSTLLSLPIFPLNPSYDDTLNRVNIHFTAGLASPSELVSVGPEFTIKYEYLVTHPFVLRTGLDYRYGRLNGLKYPDGNYHGFTTSGEVLYYRGSHKMTGFVGGGLLYNFNTLDIDNGSDDSILALNQISSVSMENRFGYRVIFGLRRYGTWSFELRISDIRNNLVYRRDLAPNRYSLQKEKVKLSDIRVSFGYILPILKL
jgi:hypothetical protein